MEKRMCKTRSGEPVFFYSILPQTRAGKSILVSSILVQALSRGIPVDEFGSPETQNTITFSGSSDLMRGAYFDICKQDHNLLEIPDFGTLPPDAL